MLLEAGDGSGGRGKEQQTQTAMQGPGLLAEHGYPEQKQVIYKECNCGHSHTAGQDGEELFTNVSVQREELAIYVR